MHTRMCEDCGTPVTARGRRFSQNALDEHRKDVHGIIRVRHGDHIVDVKVKPNSPLAIARKSRYLDTRGLLELLARSCAS